MRKETYYTAKETYYTAKETYGYMLSVVAAGAGMPV